MRVLVIGAGAVGQSFGLALSEGGAEVSFLVRPRYAGEVDAGLVVHRVRRLGRTQTTTLKPASVLTEPTETHEGYWDQVWIALSSTALRGPWLDELTAGLDAGALVMLQPGLGDLRYVLDRWPSSRLVQGVITLVAWQAPLEGERLDPPGIAVWIPPGTKVPLAGPEPLARDCAEALSRGGLPATFDPDGPTLAASLSAAMMPALVGLELSGWSLERLRHGPHLRPSLAAAREALAIVAAELKRPEPLWAGALRPAALGALLRLAHVAMPLPVEIYLQQHFTKVGDQTRAMLQTYIDKGVEQGLGTRALEALIAELTARDGWPSEGRYLAR